MVFLSDEVSESLLNDAYIRMMAYYKRWQNEDSYCKCITHDMSKPSLLCEKQKSWLMYAVCRDELHALLRKKKIIEMHERTTQIVRREFLDA